MKGLSRVGLLSTISEIVESTFPSSNIFETQLNFERLKYLDK